MKPVFPVSAVVRARERLALKGGRSEHLDFPVRYGLFTRPNGAPVLIDTGYSPRVTSGRRSLALKLYAAALGPRLDPDGGLDRVLDANGGLRPADVTDVVITHFHADHVAALRDLPNARFHASGEGYARLKRAGRLGRLRHGVFFELLPEDFEARLIPFEDAPTVAAPLGLGSASDLFGDGSALALPLPGHAAGHHGVVFAHQTPPLLYAADAQWVARALDGRAPGFPASLVAEDRRASATTDRRLLAFTEAGGRVVLCHDPDSPE